MVLLTWADIKKHTQSFSLMPPRIIFYQAPRGLTYHALKATLNPPKPRLLLARMSVFVSVQQNIQAGNY